MADERCSLLRELILFDAAFRSHVNRNGGMRSESQNIQTHHIFGGTSRRNEPANLIRLASVTHDYAHDFKPTEIKIACLWYQAIIARVLNWEQLDKSAGGDGRARGWVETRKGLREYEWMQVELMNWNCPIRQPSTPTGGSAAVTFTSRKLGGSSASRSSD